MDGKASQRLITVSRKWSVGSDQGVRSIYPRYVYSYLVGCNRQTARASSIHRHLGIHLNTIAKSAAALMAVGLVRKLPEGLMALEPQGGQRDWFTWMSADPHWYRDFGYLKVYLPSHESAVGLDGATMYAFLRFRARKTGVAAMLNYKYLSMVLGLDPRSVRRILGTLETGGLIARTESDDPAFLSWSVSSPEIKPSWFRDAPLPYLAKCRKFSPKPTSTTSENFETIHSIMEESPRGVRTDDQTSDRYTGRVQARQDRVDPIPSCLVPDELRSAIADRFRKLGVSSDVGNTLLNNPGCEYYPTLRELRELINNILRLPNADTPEEFLPEFKYNLINQIEINKLSPNRKRR